MLTVSVSREILSYYFHTILGWSVEAVTTGGPIRGPGHSVVRTDVKMFDSSGEFIYHFKVPNDDVDTELYILNVATYNTDNYLRAAQMGKVWN